jgi:uncharacterized membrane protein YgcG
MRSYNLEEVRASMQVPWDAARERRVLDGALALWRRRTRRKRVWQGAMAAAAVLLLIRVTPRPYWADGDEVPSFASTSSTPPPVDAPAAAFPAAKEPGGDAGTGGFAGASGLGSGGGGRNAGNGGKAGTS